MRNQIMDQKCLELQKELDKYPRLFDWLDRWAKEKPDTIALIEYNTGEIVTWKDFATKSKAFAAKLIAMGIKKGDVVATTLPLLKEHVYLMYACYRIGAILAPLDLRLKVAEVDDSFQKMKPTIYFTLGKTEVADFRPILESMIKKHSIQNGGSCKYFVQFQKEENLIVEGAIGLAEFVKSIKKDFILQGLILGKVKKYQKKVTKRDPLLIIFTTGSTGSPKPAQLCSENVLLQNASLKVAFDLVPQDSMCINLPLSHVGCTTEQLGTVIYGGGIAILLHIFDAEKTLDAVQKYKITMIGQIPALYSMQWRLPNYSSFDLSSLRFALYGGQAVTRSFLEKMFSMAKFAGTGLGLTETAGFCTYSPLDGTIDDILSSVGYDSVVCPISIREKMNDDGTAGKEKPKGEIGEICFSGPQIFLGYRNDEENTRKTISSDGILYTGDLGNYDEMGLHLAGRVKFMIKPKGYNVFPTEVEDFIQTKLKDKIASIAIIGAPHDIFTEAIIAFVEKVDGVELSAVEVMTVSKDMAAYKRPSHVEILKIGEIPLNRVNKTDYMELKKKSVQIIENLRNQNKWDKIPLEDAKIANADSFFESDEDLHKKGKLYKKFDI